MGQFTFIFSIRWMAQLNYSNQKMKGTILAVFCLLARMAIAAPADDGMESVRQIEFLTSDCSQCGMTLFGSIMTKVCGDSGCCVTPWDQGDFNEGGTDIMSGVTIGECDNFEFKQTDSDASVVGVTVFHQGTDALMLDEVKVHAMSNNMSMSKIYSCRMPQAFIDDSQFIGSEGCIEL